MHALKLPQIFVFFGQKTTQKLGGWGTFHRYTHWNSDSRLFCNNGQNPCRISDRKPLKGRVTVVTYPVTTDKLWRSYSYIASCECTWNPCLSNWLLPCSYVYPIYLPHALPSPPSRYDAVVDYIQCMLVGVRSHHRTVSFIGATENARPNCRGGKCGKS